MNEKLLTKLQEVVDRLPVAKKIDLEGLYAGGVVSIIGKGSYEENGVIIPVAIKYTQSETAINSVFSPLESRNLLKNASSSHAVDAQVLQELTNSELTVPEIISYFPDERVTIMRDFNSQGFTLLQEKIVNGADSINPTSFYNLGQGLAKSIDVFSTLPKHISGVENRELQVEERTDELRISLYNNRMDIYNEIWSTLLADSHTDLVWTDSHPKNIAINKDGDVMFFDFGRSIVIDPQYILPNFLAHIYLATLGGALTIEQGKKFIDLTLEGYLKSADRPVNEPIFVNYLISEIAHRGKTMRWIDSRFVSLKDFTKEEADIRIKAAVDHIIDLVFSQDRIVGIEEFNRSFFAVIDILHNDSNAYARPTISIGKKT